MWFLACGIIVGTLMPLQTAANSRLRASVGHPVSAVFYSFMVGTLLLVATSLLATGAVFPSDANYASAPWWIWSGGALGVGMLVGNLLLFPRVGALLTVVLPIAGQIITGLAIDQFGLLNAPRTEASLPRLLGAVLVIVGVLVSVGAVKFRGRRRKIAADPAEGAASTRTEEAATDPGEHTPSETNRNPSVWFWRVFGVALGALIASQAAVNAQLGGLLGSPIRAASISFAVGFTLLSLIVLFGRLPVRVRRVNKDEANPPWMWIGGLVGALFVTTQAILVPHIGTGLTVIATLMGMMVGSLLVDRFGLLGAPRIPVTRTKLVGLAIMLVSVALVRLVG